MLLHLQAARGFGAAWPLERHGLFSTALAPREAAPPGRRQPAALAAGARGFRPRGGGLQPAGADRRALGLAVPLVEGPKAADSGEGAPGLVLKASGASGAAYGASGGTATEAEDELCHVISAVHHVYTEDIILTHHTNLYILQDI